MRNTLPNAVNKSQQLVFALKYIKPGLPGEHNKSANYRKNKKLSINENSLIVKHLL